VGGPPTRSGAPETDTYMVVQSLLFGRRGPVLDR
jgi:hypothetical protein